MLTPYLTTCSVHDVLIVGMTCLQILLTSTRFFPLKRKLIVSILAPISRVAPTDPSLSIYPMISSSNICCDIDDLV